MNIAHGCLPCSIEHSIDALWFTLPLLIPYLRAVWHHRRRHGDCGATEHKLNEETNVK
jgi:hypothetical protein